MKNQRSTFLARGTGGGDIVMVQVAAGKFPSSFGQVSTENQLLPLVRRDLRVLAGLSPLNPPNSGGVPGVIGVEELNLLINSSC